MSAPKSSEAAKLKRLIYVCNLEGKYYCGSPDKNRPEYATYEGVLNTLLKQSHESLLKVFEKAIFDKYLPHRIQIFNILATLLTLEGATEKNKPDICQLAEKLCNCDKDLFAFIKAVISSQQKDNKKPPTTVRKSVVRYYKNKTAEDLAKSYVLHKSYYGWKHKDIIKFFHIKSETTSKYNNDNCFVKNNREP